MATVAKDFKVKNGLVVEGSTATVAGNDVLTKSTDDQNYIIGLIGGSATSDATPDTVVLRDENGSFSAVEITADIIGDVTGQVSDISNHSTSDLLEGSNLYFTNQRALDATSAAYDAAGSASTAQQNAENYADNVAGNAYDNAVSYADGLASNYDPVGSAQGAYDNAVADANSYTDTAITNLNLSGTYDALGAADQALTDSKAYTDQEVAALVEGAPALLDTLNELAAAIADNPNYATDVANLVSTKADTTYVDDQDSATLTSAQDYTDTAITNLNLSGTYDALGAADTAEQNAKSYADGLASNYDAAGSASAAQTAAETFATNAINALSTSDIEEGSNLYYTDDRAEDAAGWLLANATKTNIQISYDNGSNALTITAENGVADSTTDDLEEGSSNLYFTDERAVLALEAVTPNFVEVDLNSVATQVAASTGLVATASTVTAYAFPKADYRSAKFFVKTAYGTHTEVSEVIITLDTSDNIAITEYATVGTNGSSMSISADVSGTDVRLRVTTVNNNSTVTVVGTLLA